MKPSTRLSDALHILAFLALHPELHLSSARIAQSICTNPAYVRQLMSRLRKAGLLFCVKGHPRPALARPPAGISVLDVYRAVEGEKPLLCQDAHTNPACGVGINIQLALKDCYDRVQAKAEEEMARLTLEEVLARYRAKLEAPASTFSKTDLSEAASALPDPTTSTSRRSHANR